MAGGTLGALFTVGKQVMLGYFFWVSLAIYGYLKHFLHCYAIQVGPHLIFLSLDFFLHDITYPGRCSLCRCHGDIAGIAITWSSVSLLLNLKPCSWHKVKFVPQV